MAAGVAQLAEQLFCKQQVIGSIPFAGSRLASSQAPTFRIRCPRRLRVKAEERAALIKLYREGHRAVMDAFRGIQDEELDRSASDEWTPRQIAHHLADSEMTSGIRLRRLIVEESPVIQGYDEADFAMKLTSDRPIAPSLEVMRYVRESSAQILDRLTEADWQRAGTHSENGPYSVEDWLTIYAAHGHDHAAQIKRTRGTK
jgi:DinB family protein